MIFPKRMRMLFLVFDELHLHIIRPYPMIASCMIIQEALKGCCLTLSFIKGLLSLVGEFVFTEKCQPANFPTLAHCQ